MTGLSDPSPTRPADPLTTPILGLELDPLFKPLFAKRSGVALAVSGGSDSIALMTLAVEWARQTPGAPRLHVLTVDHGLRADAAADAEAVRQAATALDLPCDILTWTGPKPRSGVQAAARAARYRLLVERARALGLEALATAHTADDQAETILMRLARGSGLRGLSGMTEMATWLGLPLLRPFLAVERALLRAALAARGVGYRDDPSNADPRFERVRWRALMPKLIAEGLDPAALARFAARCRRADDALDMIAGEIASQATAGDEGAWVLSRDTFRRAPLDVQIRVLTRLIDRVAPPLADLGDARAAYPPRDDKLAALATALSGTLVVRRTLGGAEISARSTTLTIRRENPRRATETMHPGDGVRPYGVLRTDH